MKPDGQQEMIRPAAPSTNSLPPRPNNVDESRKDDKVALPIQLIKALRRKGSGSGSSNGSGNNSDNSALVSIGNNSFGFNFDSEEAMMNASSPPNSEKNGGSDSEGNGSCGAKDEIANNLRRPAARPEETSTNESSHEEAAAAAVANLQSIASSYKSHDDDMEEDEDRHSNLKRKAQEKSDNDSYGYKTDDEDDDGVPGQEGAQQSRSSSPATLSGPQQIVSSSSINMSSISSKGSGKKKKRVDENKREERNAREKERSFRISKQINELRNLLSSGGVIVPKGTKSSVLTEAANYIRVLQNHQYRSEIDRHQLVQQVQMIGSGALGPQAAQVIRHVAAQNGVWSLGNFGGVPPRSAMTCYQTPESAASQDGAAANTQEPEQVDASVRAKIDEHEYRLVFNSCAVGMAIASMGGAFIDCNQLFCQLSNFTKQEVCSMTIFNLTARQDLQHAFDLISQMISPPIGGSPKPCLLRGAMKNRDDLGLTVNLVKGEDGIAKCFCVSLIKNPSSPFDTSKPIPATPDLIQIQATTKDAGGMTSAPAFTSG